MVSLWLWVRREESHESSSHLSADYIWHLGKIKKEETQGIKDSAHLIFIWVLESLYHFNSKDQSKQSRTPRWKWELCPTAPITVKYSVKSVRRLAWITKQIQITFLISPQRKNNSIKINRGRPAWVDLCFKFKAFEKCFLVGNWVPLRLNCGIVGQYHTGKQTEIEIMDLLHVMNIFPLNPTEIGIKSSEANKQNFPESARMINKISDLTHI